MMYSSASLRSTPEYSDKRTQASSCFIHSNQQCLHSSTIDSSCSLRNSQNPNARRKSMLLRYCHIANLYALESRAVVSSQCRREGEGVSFTARPLYHDSVDITHGLRSPLTSERSPSYFFAHARACRDAGRVLVRCQRVRAGLAYP